VTHILLRTTDYNGGSILCASTVARHADMRFPRKSPPLILRRCSSFLFMCIPVYMHSCLHAYICTYTHVFMCTSTHVCMRTCIHACMRTSIPTCMRTCIHVSTCMHVSRRTCIPLTTRTQLPVALQRTVTHYNTHCNTLQSLQSLQYTTFTHTPTSSNATHCNTL